MDETLDDELYDANLAVTSEQDFNQTMASALEESETEYSISTPELEVLEEEEIPPPTPTSPSFQHFAMDRQLQLP